MLFPEAGFHDVDHVVAQLLQLIDHIDIERTHGIVVFMIIHSRDVLGLPDAGAAG